jgi:GDP-mannose 6-dehydrogenase
LLNEGRCLIVEPGLDSILPEEHRAGRLRATTDPVEAVLNSDVSFICVGTPSLRAGRLGLASVEGVSEQLGAALALKEQWHTVAVRSTVLPGTIESVVIPIIERVSGKRAEHDFAVCANPEFIREGTAVDDFFNPPFTILGALNTQRLKPIRDIYESVPGTVFETSIRGAEMVKYACNAFHAVKIDFANEIGSLARELGVDPNEVMDIVCADTKLNISKRYLRPGFAFGGSCLPKDIGALTHCARQRDLVLPLLQSVLPSNRAHIDRAMELILSSGKRTVGFLGLSFKSGTDDLRESAPLHLIKRLLGEGCQILIYDRSVSQSLIHGANRRFAETEIPHIFSLLRPTLNEIIKDSEVIVIGNSDEEYTGVPDLMRPGQQLIDLVGTRWPSRQLLTSVEHTPEPELHYPDSKRA